MNSTLKTSVSERKRKFVRAIFGTLSFSTALFIFQACYGTPADMKEDNRVGGVVTSKTTGLPVPGIKVSWVNQPYTATTDQAGKFFFYLPLKEEYTLRFEDIDNATNGSYLTKDTLVKTQDGQLSLQIKMDSR